MLASNPLIQVTPGLMIWTIVCFLVVLFVLKRYAFGPIQQTIDTRRERIEQAIDEADNARDEARNLLEEHRKLIGQAKTESEEILAEARRVADAQRERVRVETEEDRQRRLEETRRQIEQATAAGARPDPRRGRQAQPARGREDHAQVAHRRRPAAADRRGARRDRLLASSKGAGRSRRAPHLRARRSSRPRRTQARSTLVHGAAPAARATQSPARRRPAGDAREPRGRLAGEGGRARARRRRARTRSSSTSCG